MMRGAHLLYHWSSTQTTVALSSGEAELTGICRGASKALGMKSLCEDLGLNFSLRIHSDATAAIGICRRRGLGRIRHLSTADLWVQDKVRTGEFVLQKIAGAQNPADMLTKHIDATTLATHMKAMSLMYEDGRASTAPSLTH